MNLPNTSPDAISQTAGKKILRIYIPVWLAALMLIGTYIRMHGFTDFHLSADESEVLFIAKGRTLADVVRYSMNDPHPPLYHILLHYWIKLSDSDNFSRLLSLLLGVLSIPLYYGIGKEVSGRVTGICCATLITFSYGNITESYLNRDYACMVFLISLAYFYMLRWHKRHDAASLTGYGTASLLACLTHFGCIVAVFSMSAAEGIFWAHRRQYSFRGLKAWLMVNALVVCAIYPVYVHWKPIWDFLRPTGTDKPSVHIMLLNHSLLSPLYELLYILPRPGSIVATLGMCIAIYYLLKKRKVYLEVTFPLITLIIGSLMMMVLYVKNIIPISYVLDDRHNLWLCPFIFAVMAAKIANTLVDNSELRDNAGNERQDKVLVIEGRRQCWGVLLLMLAGLVLYSPAVRLSGGEYMMREHTYRELMSYLKRLDSRSLIIADRNTGFVISPEDYNAYEYFNHWSWVDGRKSNLVPWGAASMAFDAVDMRFWDKDTLLDMYDDARTRGLTGNADSLVFVRIGAWGALPVNNMEHCTELPMKKIYFGEADHWFKAGILIVARSDFEEKVVNPSGEARKCFK